MRPVTPRGFRDVLPAEAAEREVLVARLGETFSAWGYGRIETPVAERLDALEAAAGSLEDTAFRFVDLDGHLLALRPDLTVPVARLVGSRLAGEPGPFRFRYASEVFREHESLRGQSRQFTQVGAELIGMGGPSADAEVVSLVVEGLRAAGFSDFTVSLGTVAVLFAVVDSAGMPDAWNDEVLAAAHAGNLVELDRLASEDGVAAGVAAALKAVPRIRGGVDAIEQCRASVAGCGCDRVLDELAATWRLLEAAGTSAQVTIDFSVMRSFDYYTGIVLEAYAPGFGVPLGGGGRYDGALAAFGSPMPAAGFAFGLERLTLALVEQGSSPTVRRLDAVIGGEAAEAASASQALRAAGWRVALSARSGLELVREADDAEAIEALWAERDKVYRLDRAGEKALPLEGTPYPPSTSWAEGGDAS